jgi:hypothetical protein
VVFSPPDGVGAFNLMIKFVAVQRRIPRHVLRTPHLACFGHGLFLLDLTLLGNPSEWIDLAHNSIRLLCLSALSRLAIN